jgi:hypothetical protein
MPGKSAIEIEEEYIDTYQIAKNYTINNSDGTSAKVGRTSRTAGLTVAVKAMMLSP